MTTEAARGGERYRGPLGATRRERVHWACPCGVRHSVEVVVSIDCQADPLLARRVRDGDPAFNDTVCPETRARAWVEVPVVYHDPENRLFILILPGSSRSRELQERAALLLRLAEDTEFAVPEYVVAFTAVYGPEGLRRHLEREAERALQTRRPGDPSAPRAASDTVVSPPPAPLPGPPLSILALAGGVEDILDEEVVGGPTSPRAASPVPDVEDRWPGGSEPSARWVGIDGRVHIALRASGAELESLTDPGLEVRLQLHRMPNFPLITLLFGCPSALAGEAGPAPVWVALDISTEADRAHLHALGRRFEIHLQVHDRDRGDRLVARTRMTPPLGDNVLCALSAAAEYLRSIPAEDRSFGRGLAAFDEPDHDRLGLVGGRAADLDEAIQGGLATPSEVMRAAVLVKRLSQPSGEDWLIMTRGYPMETWQARRRAVVGRAVELGIWPGPVAAQIAVSEGLARSRKELAVLLQRNFASLLARDETPHDLDDHAVEENWKALRAESRALGLPPAEWGAPRSEPVMSDAQPIASGLIGLLGDAAEGSDLLPLLPRRRLGSGTQAETDAADDTDASETEELNRYETDEVPTDAIRAGEAGVVAEEEADLTSADEDELIGALADRDHRLGAALELCRRGAANAVEPLFAALDRFSRAEAGQVLGSVLGLGRACESHLMEELRSRKPHLRQGSALALALLRSEAGVEAICDLLLDEPTEIWREVARALGETGAAAVMPLAARLGQRPEAVTERAAWALAHIAARGARRPIETLAAGRDPIAAGVARHGLELADLAGRDQVSVQGERTPRDQTLNRAFSRRFFQAVRAARQEAAEKAAADEAGARAAAPLTTGTAILLDSSDLLEVVEVEEGEELDVADADPDEADRLRG